MLAILVLAALAKLYLEQLEEDAFLKKYPVEDWELFYHQTDLV